jgi:superfamily II DNA helicase RecQ
MVFCSTRRNVDFVANNLKSLKIQAQAIHGGLAQNKEILFLKNSTPPQSKFWFAPTLLHEDWI